LPFSLILKKVIRKNKNLENKENVLDLDGEILVVFCPFIAE